MTGPLSFNVSSVYDFISKDYDALFDKPSAHIENFLDILPNKGKILDVGCGTGVDSAYMSSLGFVVVGIDVSGEMLHLAKQKQSNAQFLKKDIKELDFNDKSFDGILASYSLIHIPKVKIKDCLRNFHKMLKTGGILSIGLHEGELGELTILEPFAPHLTLDINIMSFKEISTLLDETGFSVLQHFIESPKITEEFGFNKLCIIAKVV